MGFSLTAKQHEAQQLMASPQTHTMLFGGSRSGKTFLIVRAYCIRAMKHDGARQAMLRFRFNAIKNSIGRDTLPKVMRLCFPGAPYTIDKSDWVVLFPNKSEIWLGGLDDKERTEKILGNEYCGMFLNECSQISWESRNVAVTRLAQNDCGARLRMDYDCNPPNQSHWTYKVFRKHIDPKSGSQLANPGNFASMMMNPEDNQENLPEDYIAELDLLPERFRKRFKKGEFLPVAENALWSSDTFDLGRVLDLEVPDMQRIVVAVDPSGADEENPERDDIGIVVAGVGTDGIGYVLEDLTINASPAKWGQIAASAYDRHRADRVVGEENFGGAMVRHVIQTARPGTPYRPVTASRGKVVRAEPISALYEKVQDKPIKVRHVGFFPELEDELCNFTTTGYQGDASPNRADALIWALSDLFPGMTQQVVESALPPPPVSRAGFFAG